MIANPTNTVRALVAHPGTQSAPLLATELEKLGALGIYATGLAIGAGGLLALSDRAAPTGVRKKWARRRVPGVPAGKMRLFPWLELKALWRLRSRKPAEQVLLERNEAFQAAIPDSWLEQSSHVVGYDTSSWLLAPRCAAIGTPFLLEQTIAHSRAKERVFAEVRSRYPEWAEDVRPKAERILELEEREHRAASVVTAPCTFVKATLVEHGVDAEKIEVLPLGVDCAQFRPSSRPGDGKRPIRFLFLGHVTARKGIPCLLEAWSRMGASGAELWIAGNVSEAVRPLLPQMKGLRILGRLPEEQLAQTYRQCDVFVFPSFFEGFGLVLLEAMACGLPLISTEATAAPDLVKEGREGFVIPAGDSASLADRMSRFLDAPGLSQEMGAAARSRAAQFTWESYGLHWLRTMESIGRGSETSAALPAVAHPPRVP